MVKEAIKSPPWRVYIVILIGYFHFSGKMTTRVALQWSEKGCHFSFVSIKIRQQKTALHVYE